MGYHKDIHKNIYRIPVPVAEMTDVSRLLVAAMGGEDEKDDVDDLSTSDSETEQNETIIVPSQNHTQTSSDEVLSKRSC